MKPTGRFNPFGDEIMEIEEHDILFWDKAWEELTDHEKADYLSFKGIPFLATKGEFANEEIVKALYYSDSYKNR